MITRGISLSIEHVSAINQIILEFPQAKFPEVYKSWQNYLVHLNDKTYGAERVGDWENKRQDLLPIMLDKMGTTLRMSKEFMSIKGEYYRPQGHVDIENENIQIRRMIIELLTGKRDLNVRIDNQEKAE
jgi:hypothetical protein